MDINDGSFDPELGKRAELNALALLTAAHHRSDVGTVLGAILGDATESADGSVQHLANSIEQLTNLVQGLIVISHTLLVRLASEMGVEAEELLDALGRGQVQGRGVRRRRVILRGDGSGGQCRRCVLLF